MNMLIFFSTGLIMGIILGTGDLILKLANIYAVYKKKFATPLELYNDFSCKITTSTNDKQHTFLAPVITVPHKLSLNIYCNEIEIPVIRIQTKVNSTSFIGLPISAHQIGLDNLRVFINNYPAINEATDYIFYGNEEINWYNILKPVENNSIMELFDE